MKLAKINALSEQVTEVLLYEQIGSDFFGDGISAKDFRGQLKAIKTPTINLRINSPGGDVFEASAMLAALDEHPARIEVDVDGVAASAGSVVMMGGDHIRVASNAFIMIHNPYAAVAGDANEMRRMGDLLDKVRETILDSYMRRASKAGQFMNRVQLSQAMDAETWYTGAEAVQAGLADEASKPVSIAAFADLLTIAAKLGAKHPPKLQQTPEQLQAIAETDKRRAIAAKLIATCEAVTLKVVKPTVPVKTCERCSASAIQGERFCGGCRKVVLQKLNDDKYLQHVPSRRVLGRHGPGPRVCEEGSGGWDNAVRAIEEG